LLSAYRIAVYQAPDRNNSIRFANSQQPTANSLATGNCRLLAVGCQRDRPGNSDRPPYGCWLLTETISPVM
jgi:hypothetical protein